MRIARRSPAPSLGNLTLALKTDRARMAHGFRVRVSLRANFGEPWRDWTGTQLSGAATRAPWLAASPLAAL